MVIKNNTTIDLVTYRPPFSAICSVGDAPFNGTLEITYQPMAVLLEFEAFEQWLRQESQSRHTIESFCDMVFERLETELETSLLCVAAHAQTIVHAPVIVKRETKP